VLQRIRSHKQGAIEASSEKDANARDIVDHLQTQQVFDAQPKQSDVITSFVSFKSNKSLQQTQNLTHRNIQTFAQTFLKSHMLLTNPMVAHDIAELLLFMFKEK
jgi:hypothetical protein